jgi:hypothetical protein
MMAVQVQITSPLGAGIGGLIQGAWGNYQPASDGSYTVDSRDAATLLAQGFNYVKQIQAAYTLPLAPGAATVGYIVASGALSNGTVALSHGTDVLRPVTVEVGTGTAAITAGNIAVTYVGNDGLSATENYSLVCAASTAVTQTLSRGVDSISLISVTGVVGGTSPWLRMSTTAAISVPVAPGAIDFAVQREWDAGATIAAGSTTATLGTVAVTTAPNGTVTYSFNYFYVAPQS